VVALREQRHVGDLLANLAGALESLELGRDASKWTADRDRLAGTIRSYLIPRTEDPPAPLTVVVAGPTGSGKSTLINSLIGHDVSRTGALRPTTRQPMVVAGPESPGRLQSIGGVECQIISAEAPILDSLVLVDTPDIDSTSTHHRAMAEVMIDNADVVVFVTSALRYADDVPWRVLRRAVSRGAPVIQVLNRVGSASSGAVVDFKSRLAAASLDDDVVVVPEHHIGHTQRVPAVAVQSLRRRLGRVVTRRDEFAAQVFDRVLRSTLSQVAGLTRELTEFEDRTDEIAAELSLSLGERLSALDLDDVAEGLAPAPRGTSRLAISRWKRGARRVDTDSMEAQLADVVERIVSLIHGDLRQWLVAERRHLQERGLHPAGLIAGMVARARSSLEGWVGFVERIAVDHDPGDHWLAQSTLIEAATGSTESGAVLLLFGDEGDVLVDRARRELWGRVEFVYAGAVDLVIDAVRQRHGHFNDHELRAALGAVTSILAPAYA
jgi:energy-coupling factor transporter ATP-binding protein EcfA2